ncbi:Diguanylate cyclase DosC [Symmachiella dynata]|uniref:sensor domain-containing diguanylate cyclase n=1 Tax=Symmachiella dynata TaxID=2527995 RepID=UPI0011894ECB|nr:GGDEF domain-containing protein [Symmachiella dynata]QDT51442.1 Diguanylate cyclase DosC [Symmachiella dynata]
MTSSEVVLYCGFPATTKSSIDPSKIERLAPPQKIPIHPVETMIDPETIWTSKHLPTLPSVAVELLKLRNDPEAGIAEVQALVRNDPAISAKILKAVNSTFFGVSSQVTSLERAVSLLGGTYVTSLALSFYLSQHASTTGPLSEYYARYWLQSVVQATAAETLGRRAKQRMESELFLAGLLLDLGQLAMLKAIPDEYQAVMTTAATQSRDLYEIEREQLGFDHMEIGVKLAETWELPETLWKFIGSHHAAVEEPETSEDPAAHSQERALALAACVGDFFCANSLGIAYERLQKRAAHDYGMDEQELEEFLNEVRARIEDVADQFSAQANQLEDPAELMAQASEQLANLVMQESVANLHATARHEAAVQAKHDLESQHHELQQQSQYDRLTTAFNRAYFEDALDTEVGRCVQTAHPLGLIFCDIDQFKQANDTYGHQFGDQILKQVAAAFLEVLRPDDILARYGGDEFVVLVSNPTLKGLEKLAERIRLRIETEQFEIDGCPLTICVSLGAALDIPGRSCVDVGDRVIAAADQEMYKSKHAGGNRSQVRSLICESSARLEQLVTNNRFSRWLVANQILDIPVVSRALLQVTGQKAQIGQLAVSCKVLRSVDVQTILAEQECTGERFGEVALRLDLLSEDQLVDLLILQREDPSALLQAIASQDILSRVELQCALEAYATSRTDVICSEFFASSPTTNQTTDSVPSPSCGIAPADPR